MKTIITLVLLGMVILYFLKKNISVCESCKNCKYLELTNSIIMEEYISSNCFKEDKCYYCKKQNRYVYIFSPSCNDYHRN